MALSTASFLIIASLLFNSLRFSRSQCQGQGSSNLALNGTAKQSTSASNATSAQKAIVDDLSRSAQTKREAFPFWEVVLRSISNISQITIFTQQLPTDCSSYSVLFYDDACRLKGAYKAFKTFLFLDVIDYSVDYTRSVAIRCSNSSSSLLPRLALDEVVICGSETNEGATSRSTTFCSETPFSASLQTLSCASAVPTTASTSSPTTSSTSSPTTTTLTTSDPPYNVNTITSSVMTSSFLSPTSVVHFTPLPTLLPPMTSSFLSSTSVVVRSTPVPTSTTPTFTTTRIPVSPEDVNVFLPNCTNVKCALDTAQNLSDYVSGARSFANSVTLLQGASSALDHFASFLENQSVNFSLANESASLATKIGADLTGQAGLPNENPAATNILRSIKRIYAIAASTLKVGQKPITYESTGRGGAASNFASVIAAYNSNTSILKQRLSRANARIRACKNVTFNRQT